MKDFDAIAEEIRAEREAQIRKWGEQAVSPEKFCVILGEEFGEVCKALLDRDMVNYRYELIQTAAVCVKMIQAYDREVTNVKV